jgi:ubiquinone/menaquinone biosynthesis C-methylase UbiE
MAFKKKMPSGFNGPTVLPVTTEQGQEWQDANKNWWQKNPMRYDWRESIVHREFTKDYYEEIDMRFFSLVREYMPWKKIPFDPIINYESLKDMDVLEIGVGSGSHAKLIGQHARSFVGIDITDHAIKSTSERMKLYAIKANIIRMDAENLEFENNSFDFIWTWGVIHHSSNTEKILSEMQRVLRNRGHAITMVYHRNIWNYYIVGLLYGLFKGKLLKSHSVHKTIQSITDGAIARYYTVKEWEDIAGKYFDVISSRIYGQKGEIIPLPGGKLKNMISNIFPDSVSRIFTNRLKLGMFLVSFLSKRMD